MEPIINPWIFYLLQVVDATITIGMCLILYGVIGSIIVTIEKEISWKYLKWTVLPGVIGILVMLLIPNSETLTKMIVASFITPDNIELGVEGVKAIFEYIVDTAAKMFSSQ